MAVGLGLQKTFAALYNSPRLRETGRHFHGVDKTWMGIGYLITKTALEIDRWM
jgi:hypothetical protein